jgi:5-methylcytosine-specific restriction endonuclease McrA
MKNLIFENIPETFKNIDNIILNIKNSLSLYNIDLKIRKATYKTHLVISKYHKMFLEIRKKDEYLEKDCIKITIEDNHCAYKMIKNKLEVDNINKFNNILKQWTDIAILNKDIIFKNSTKLKEIREFIKNTGIDIKDLRIIKRKSGYIRKEIYSLEDIFNKINWDKQKSENSNVNFDGDLIYMNSHRYWTFYLKGIKCVNCGIEGKYFAKEKDAESKYEKYHFNLYAINKHGHEILMTKDHIIPKSKGGKDHIDNYQTMCVKCNGKKGNKLEGEMVELQVVI